MVKAKHFCKPNKSLSKLSKLKARGRRPRDGRLSCPPCRSSTIVAVGLALFLLGSAKTGGEKRALKSEVMLRVEEAARDVVLLGEG